MQNKKGILTKNVLSLIIAAIGVVLLIFVSVALYNNFENQERKNAKSFLNSIESKIENLGDGETNKFILRGIKGWYLLGWSKDDLNRPEKCFFNSCLCVCPEVENPEDFGKSCQNNGFCREINYDNIDLGSSIGWISEDYNYIDLNNNFREFKNKRSQSLIDIHEIKLKEITVHKNLEKVPFQEKINNLKINNTLFSEMIIIKSREDFGSGFTRIPVFEGVWFIGAPRNYDKFDFDSYHGHKYGSAKFPFLGLPSLLNSQDDCLHLGVIHKDWFKNISHPFLLDIPKIYESINGFWSQSYYLEREVFIGGENPQSIFRGDAVSNVVERFNENIPLSKIGRVDIKGTFNPIVGEAVNGNFSIDHYYGPCRAEGN